MQGGARARPDPSEPPDFPRACHLPPSDFSLQLFSPILPLLSLASPLSALPSGNLCVSLFVFLRLCFCLSLTHDLLPPHPPSSSLLFLSILVLVPAQVCASLRLSVSPHHSSLLSCTTAPYPAPATHMPSQSLEGGPGTPAGHSPRGWGLGWQAPCELGGTEGL